MAERSDREADFSWTPVALVNSVTTPFEVYKAADATEKSPKRSGFRNVRTNRGSFRHSNSVITQRPPPKPVSFARPEEEVAYPPAHETLPLEETPSTSSVPPPLPVFSQEDPVGSYSIPVPAVVEHQEEDDLHLSNHRPLEQQERPESADEWREARVINTYAREPRRPDKVISANGQVIQLIPFTLEDTVPRTTPTYFPHPAFNEQLNEAENTRHSEEDSFARFQSAPTPPSFEGPRKETSFSGRAPKNNTISRNRENKRNNGPNFISNFNNNLSQDAGIGVTRNPNDFTERPNHPNGAFSRQVINVGNKTLLEVLPKPAGRHEIHFGKNGSIQEPFNNTRNHRQFGGQSSSLGHRPAVGFDRYRVPAASVRPKVGYNLRARHPSNALHHHHHAHDSHMSPSISVGRYALPPNTLVHAKPKGNGHVHRHPSHSNSPYGGTQHPSVAPHLNSPHPNSPHPNPPHPNSPHPNNPHQNSPHINSQHPNSPYSNSNAPLPNSQHPNAPVAPLPSGPPHPNPHAPSGPAHSNNPPGPHPSSPSNPGGPHNIVSNPNVPLPQGASGNVSANGGRFGPQQPFPKPDYRPGNLPHPAPLSDLKRPLSVHEHLSGAPHKYPGRYASPYGKHRPQGLRPQVHPGDDVPHGPPPHRKPLYGLEDSRPPQGPQQGPGRYPGPGGKGGPSGHGPSGLGLGGLSGPSAQGGHGPSGLGPERYASHAQGIHKPKYGYNEPGKLPPTPQRNQYPGAHDDAYASGAINHDRYVPSGPPKYKGPVPTYSAAGYENAPAQGYDKPPAPVYENSGPAGYGKPSGYENAPTGNYDNAPAASYNNKGPVANDQLPQGQPPNVQSPAVHTYPFPTNPSAQQTKPTLPGHRTPDDVRNSDEYEEDHYYPPHNHNVKPTTIRPTGYKNPNLNKPGFSITEITQPSDPSADNVRRPTSDEPNKPRHYGFPRLSASTARTPGGEDPVATSSQSVRVGANNYNKNAGYGLYEEENYPTPKTTSRPRVNKFSPSVPSPHRGKTSYASGGSTASSTSRPRHRPRRPGGLRGDDAQAEGTSVTAAYGPPAGTFGDAQKGAAGDTVFTFAKTDYSGNVKWGVRHKVTMQGGGDDSEEYGH